jgi:hypothetical protein
MLGIERVSSYGVIRKYDVLDLRLHLVQALPHQSWIRMIRDWKYNITAPVDIYLTSINLDVSRIGSGVPQ